MDNPSIFEYDMIMLSDLSKKVIIMIGRGGNKAKRFDLWILAIKRIIKEIPECQMNIISLFNENLNKSIYDLELENNIKLVGYPKELNPIIKF